MRLEPVATHAYPPDRLSGSRARSHDCRGVTAGAGCRGKPVFNTWAHCQRRGRFALCPSGNLEPGNAADLHRTCRCRRLPRKTLEHWCRGAALRRGNHCGCSGGRRNHITACSATLGSGGSRGRALVLLGPVLLKTRLGVDEVVTTLLFNFIMLLIVSWLLEGPMKDPAGMGWPKSWPLIAEARLPRIVTGLRLHWGFGLAIIAAVIVWIIQTRTTLGFEMRGSGPEPAGSAVRRDAGQCRADQDGLLSGGLQRLPAGRKLPD